MANLMEVLRLFGRIGLAALVIWREARHESYRCKLAVAYTIQNRVDVPRNWGTGVLGVLFYPWAFSSVTDPKDLQLTKWPRDGAVWDECLKAAAGALFKMEENPVPGAVFYHSFPKETPPKAWGPVKLVAHIDHIYFFKQ